MFPSHEDMMVREEWGSQKASEHNRSDILKKSHLGYVQRQIRPSRCAVAKERFKFW